MQWRLGLASPGAYAPSNSASLGKFKCSELFAASYEHTSLCVIPFLLRFYRFKTTTTTVIANLRVFIGACPVPRLPWMQRPKEKESI